MSDSLDVVDLFPLGTVLLPYGRIPLQIFEARYLDLVTECLKKSKGFGVVLIDQGDEVIRNKDQHAPSLKQYGCYGEIVNWDGLPNQRLAIIVEGRRVFEIQESWMNPNSKRMQASVAFLPEEEPVAVTQQQPGLEEIHDIFTRLLEHPMITALQYSADWNDLNAISFALGQLLPIDKRDRYSLLSLNSKERLQSLQHFIERLGGN